MRGINKVILVGHVGKEPEVRTFAEGKAVANFSLATSEKYRDRDGNDVEQTEWHRVVVYGRLADIVQRYVGKGQLLYLEGKLRTRSWEADDGTKRYATEVLAFSLQMLGRRDSDQGGGRQRHDDQQAPRQYSDYSDTDNRLGPPSHIEREGRRIADERAAASGGVLRDPELDDDLPF